MKNKIVVITGPTSGVGKVLVRSLGKKGYKLVLLTQCENDVQDLIAGIKRETCVEAIETDLSDLASVRDATLRIKNKYEQIDLLVNNSEVLIEEKQLSANQFERTFATNYLGHFLLTTELIQLLKVAERARVVHVASEAHRFARFNINGFLNPSPYIHFIVYANSKLANILFSNELSARYSKFGITSNAFHPGELTSGFGGVSKSLVHWYSNQGKPIFKNVEKGAQTAIFLATSPEVEGKTGGYYENLKLVPPSRAAQNKEFALQLWDWSERLVEEYRD